MPLYGCFANCCCDDGFGSVRKYDKDGNLLWSRDHGATILDVAVDPLTGNVFAVGRSSVFDQMTIRAYDRNGCSLWSDSHGEALYGSGGVATVKRCAVDQVGNLLTVGDAVESEPGGPLAGVVVRKYNPVGVRQWEAGGFFLQFNYDLHDIVTQNEFYWLMGGGDGFVAVTSKYRLSDGVEVGPSISREDAPNDVEDVNDFAIDIHDTHIVIGGETAAFGDPGVAWEMQKNDDVTGDLTWRVRAADLLDLKATADDIWTMAANSFARHNGGTGTLDSGNPPFRANQETDNKRIDARAELIGGDFVYLATGDLLEKYTPDTLVKIWSIDHGGFLTCVDASTDGLIDCVVVGGERVVE